MKRLPTLLERRNHFPKELSVRKMESGWNRGNQHEMDLLDVNLSTMIVCVN